MALLQSFDPTGVGARDLAECIALQAKEADRYDPCMARLIDNLDLVARGAFDQLKRLCRVDDEDLRDMLVELRGYDPKPGLRFDSDDAAVAVTPDIFVTAQGKGWAIELNSANLPRLLVNRSLLCRTQRGRQGRQGGEQLAQRVPCRCQLADQGDGPAPADNHESRDRIGEATGRLLPRRRVAAETADPAAGGRSDRHARIDGQPCHQQQISALLARAV